jgi:hypothetical protein
MNFKRIGKDEKDILFNRILDGIANIMQLSGCRSGRPAINN